MAAPCARMWGSLGIGWFIGSTSTFVLALAPFNCGEAAFESEIADDDYLGLSLYGNRTTAAKLRWALGILDPHGLLDPYVEVTDTTARIESGLDIGATQVALSKVEIPRDRPRSMAHMRILIDPGHHGGAWSEIENRHQQLDERPPVREGDLNWATALLLRDRLRAAGAQVQLTRGPPPTESFQGSSLAFDADREARLIWGEEISGGHRPAPRFSRSLLALWRGGRVRQAIIDEAEPFSLYSRYDLRRRASIGRGFDLTVSIHYNTTGPRRDNWVMAFVPGNLLPGEADTPTQRYWALRRALEGDLPESIELGRLVMESMTQQMQLRVLDPSVLDSVEMPNKLPIPDAPGVFARNLAILKRTPGPVLLVEGSCVDNAAEYERLQDRSVTIDGQSYPRRTREYADAVFAGVQCWLERKPECRSL
ncbi:MAG: hypothetical protein A2289_08760 [Deltaproteobacteria bacterium RIFOXYA12_FULL_58_15]|nr:MAG: hypothetical protein A2289_08760 [Deltaproteobacteria bacterium RIFOXYA12_FULL_58_15]OGR09331.1 MAG: hypothetical protein A2341_15835 [Deltaproteobacteria bacterium RIFOXYB12_FULL_58_9]